VRNLLAGIAGANAIGRQKLAQLGAKAYVIGSQLATDPEVRLRKRRSRQRLSRQQRSSSRFALFVRSENEVLVPHVEEIKRLKRQARRKKSAAMPPNQPSPSPSTPAPGAPNVETKQ
jgi:hypothetical protein